MSNREENTMTSPQHAYRPGTAQCICGDPRCTIHIREQTLQETAEHIHHYLSGPPGLPGWYDYRVSYRDAKRPPTDVEAIKDTLRSGHAWISWLDPKVADAMRLMFGPPSSGDYGG